MVANACMVTASALDWMIININYCNWLWVCSQADGPTSQAHESGSSQVQASLLNVDGSLVR